MVIPREKEWGKFHLDPQQTAWYSYTEARRMMVNKPTWKEQKPPKMIFEQIENFFVVAADQKRNIL